MIQLKLDQAALVSLFPEGSEARLNLQNACIAQFTKNLFERHMPEEAVKHMKEQTNEFADRLSAALTGARQQIIDQAALDHGLVSTKKENFGRSLTAVLSDATVSKIKTAVIGRMDEEVREAVTTAIQERVKTYIEGPGRFDDYITRTVEAQLKLGVVAKVKAALE